MSGVLHTFCVSGNLKANKGVLSFKLPNPEIRYNYWQLSISEILIKIITKQGPTLNKPITLSCNFITHTKYNKNHEIEFCHPTLNFLPLKSVKADDLFNIIRPEKTWFHVNNCEEHLKLFFFDASETEKYCEEDVDLQVIVHFQRVK